MPGTSALRKQTPARPLAAVARSGSYSDLLGKPVNAISLIASTGTDNVSASANVSVLNAAIVAANAAGGGTVQVLTPGTYYVNDHVLMRSNVRLFLDRAVTLKKINNATNNVCMIRNANPSATTSDSNIVIEGGGTIDGNYANNASTLVRADTTTATIGTVTYGIQGDVSLIGVQGIVVRDLTFLECNGFALQVSGNNQVIGNLTFDTNRDGVHINGPSKGIDVRNLYGRSNDALLAFNAWDWQPSGVAVGDIEDFYVSHVEYLGASTLNGVTRSGCAVGLLPGTRSSGYGQGTANIRNGLIENVRADSCQIGAVEIISDYDQTSGVVSGAGTVENVKFVGGHYAASTTAGTVGAPAVLIRKNTSGSPVDNETQLTIRNVSFEKYHFDATPAVANGVCGVLVLYQQAGLSVQGLRFIDCSWKPSATYTGQFLNVQSKSALDSIEIDGFTYEAAGPGNVPVVNVALYNGTAGSEVKNLAVHRIQTAPGISIDTPLIFISGIVDWLNGRDWAATFTGGSGDNHGITFSGTVAQLVDGLLSGLRLVNPKELFSIGGGITSGVVCKATVRDSTIIGCTHPIFVKSGRQADIRFRGGNIDTPANLARVDNSTAGSALTLTLDGTTSSGAGANAITLVSAPTVRVPRSGSIALPLNTLALTPADGDEVYSSATPSTVVSGTGAGRYIYRGSGTVGWVKLN